MNKKLKMMGNITWAVFMVLVFLLAGFGIGTAARAIYKNKVTPVKTAIETSKCYELHDCTICVGDTLCHYKSNPFEAKLRCIDVLEIRENYYKYRFGKKYTSNDKFTNYDCSYYYIPAKIKGVTL